MIIGQQLQYHLLPCRNSGYHETWHVRCKMIYEMNGHSKYRGDTYKQSPVSVHNQKSTSNLINAFGRIGTVLS